MYNRQEQKQETKSIIRGHQRFFFILFIPFLITEIVYSVIGNKTSFNLTSENGIIKLNNTELLINFASSIVFSILAAIFIMGAIYTVFNVLRGQDDFENPLRKSLSFIDNQRLFWGTVWTWILRTIFLSLWSLLTIPGVVVMFLTHNSLGVIIGILEIIAVVVFVTIKSFEYSQALWIYRDNLLNNKKSSAFTAIKTSSKLMKGFKVDYFVLQLSFIGWMILVAITYGIVGLYVYPYYYITLAKFYEFVKEQYKQDNTVLDVE